MKSKHIGSSVESFFEEEGMFEEVSALAAKKVVALEVHKAMKAKRVSEAELSRRMGTSRTSVRRLLEPTQKGLTLDTLGRAADVLGCDIQIHLRPRPVAARRAVSKPKHAQTSKRVATR